MEERFSDRRISRDIYRGLAPLLREFERLLQTSLLFPKGFKKRTTLTVLIRVDATAWSSSPFWVSVGITIEPTGKPIRARRSLKARKDSGIRYDLFQS